MKRIKKNFLILIATNVCLILPLLSSANVCYENIKKVDTSLKAQYGEDYPWWDIFGCIVLRKGTLRRDAVVTIKQLKQISELRFQAYNLGRENKLNECLEVLRPAKQMLHIYS